LINALYVPNGDDPVGKPNLNGFSGVGFALMILDAI
jgi:hypothetical protein